MTKMKDIEQNMRVLEAAAAVKVPELIWTNLEAELDTPKRKFGLLPFLLVFALSLISYGIWTYNSGQNTPSEPISSLPAISSNKNENTTSNQALQIQKEPTEEISIDLINTAKGRNNQPKQVPISISKPTIDSKKSTLLNYTNNETSVSSNQTSSTYSERRELLPIAQLPTKKSTPSSHKVLGTIEMTDPLGCPTFSREFSLSPYIEMNFSGGMHARNLSSTNSPTLLANRQDTEKSWYNYGGNITVGLNLFSSFYIGAGIQMGQLKNKFSYSERGISQQIINFDPAGNPIDTIIVQGTFESKGEIRHNLLDAHLLLGYGKSTDKWYVGAEGGPLFNIQHSTTGKIVTESGSVSRIGNERLIYKESLGLGMQGSFVISRIFENRISLQIKPTFKRYFSNFNTEAYSIDESVSQFQIQVGIRKDF